MKKMNSAEIKRFVTDWYRKLDVHAPMVDILPMLSQKGLKMRFPEATLEGQAAFEAWYQGVIRIFFDEVHQVKVVRPRIQGDEAKVKIVVRWEASRWRPPAASSDRIVCDAFQTWTVRRGQETGLLEVVAYIVDKIKYAEGSARL